ncbi:Uncharacterized protein HZ326_29014 [Fusarium oxysporum f. sp. albedinis]|nr:Uncharacterized protein HZ326_29014 [Fusarium oxysporum f. sp. albedinis]
MDCRLSHDGQSGGACHLTTEEHTQPVIAHSVPSFRIARLHLLVCHNCLCTLHGPVHQLRGQLPAIKPLSFDRVCIKTENGNGPKLFSLSPKSFRKCPNRPVMQRVWAS